MSEKQYTLVINSFFDGGLNNSFNLGQITLPAFRELFNLGANDPCLGAHFSVSEEALLKLRAMTKVEMNDCRDWYAELVEGKTQVQLSRDIIAEIVQQERLFELCQKFIKNNKIKRGDVKENYDVLNVAPDLVEGICDILGYYEN